MAMSIKPVAIGCVCVCNVLVVRAYLMSCVCGEWRASETKRLFGRGESCVYVCVLCAVHKFAFGSKFRNGIVLGS